MAGVVLFRSTAISPEPRVEKAAAALARQFTVHVVGWDRSGKLPSRQERTGYTLELFGLRSKFGSGAKSLFHQAIWQLYLFAWVIRHHKDVKFIHACDFDCVLPALLGKLLFRIWVVYDIFDFYADHIRSTPNWLKVLIRWLDRWVIAQVDAVILVDEARAIQLGDVKPRKLEIIYNTPMDLFTVEEPQKDFDGLKIAFVGSLQVERGLVEILEMMPDHPSWKLELAGYGGDETIIREKAAGKPNVTWRGRVDYEEALQISKKADVLFALYDPRIPNHRLASPNKVFEAMMLGKPIIVAHGTHMDEIVLKHDCGLVVDFQDSTGIEAAFQNLEENPRQMLTLGANGRKAYLANYRWEEMEKRLFALYDQLG